jgi:hypothetical protein
MPVHPGPAGVAQDRPGGSLGDRAVNGPPDGGRQRDEHKVVTLANYAQDAQVTSNLEKRVRLTVRFDGMLAWDIEMPGTPSECQGPMYQYAYRLPRGQTTVTATTDRGQRERTTLAVGGDRRWVVVQVQDGFPLELETWDSQPQWG